MKHSSSGGAAYKTRGSHNTVNENSSVLEFLEYDAVPIS